MLDEKMYINGLVIADIESVKSKISSVIDCLYAAHDSNVTLRKKSVLDFISDVHFLVGNFEDLCEDYK